MHKYNEDLEIPLGKRTKFYRFFEMVPAIISYGAFILLIVLSLVSPLLAAIYLMLVVIALLVRAVGIVYHTLAGHNRLVKSQLVHWAHRLEELNDPAVAYEKHAGHKAEGFGMVLNARVFSSWLAAGAAVLAIMRARLYHPGRRRAWATTPGPTGLGHFPGFAGVTRPHAVVRWTAQLTTPGPSQPSSPAARV